MRSWRRALAPSALALALAAGGCGGDDDGGGAGGGGAGAGGPWGSFAERPCAEDSFLSYENFGGPFMLTWCNGCHGAGVPDGMRQGAPVGIDFDTIDDVRRQAERIWARSGDQNATMPPIGGPHEDERALLGEWLACGAKTDAELGQP